ncbi:MAG: PEP-CTERM sorting domain-containing protein [Bryobacterales bacterium]|nr:PEP-CTERM sorting domain-containing protein [Bryobacterales bacterium]
MFRRSVTAASLFAFLTLAPSAFGAFIPLAGTVELLPLDTLAPGMVSATDFGTLLASRDELYSFTTTAGTTSGVLRSAVYRNPNGTLDFWYQVTNDSTSATEIARETNTSFVGFQTWVGFMFDGGALPGLAWTTGTKQPITSDGNIDQSVVGFSFRPPDATAKIKPGETSAALVISTDAIFYTLGNSAVIDGGTQTVTTFQPAIPEPSTWVLGATGLLGIFASRRWKRKS